MQRILITGGAGFIGSHLAAELLDGGYEVRVLDNLAPQVHGGDEPRHLPAEVELQRGDVRDPEAVRCALDGVDAVCHLAALVGVGQSMYQIADHCAVNTVGTAVLLEQLCQHPVGKLVVASSMSVYGEGLYRDDEERLVLAAERSLRQLRAGRWEPVGPSGEPLSPVPTTEHKPPSLVSVYALTKYDQERLCLMAARAYGFAATALRIFNVYGPWEARSNRYTGPLASFGVHLLGGRPPLLFEDGQQRRDFVSVHDVARAFRLALERPESNGQVFNIGSGESFPMLEIVERIAAAVGVQARPVITGKYRMGDIRHCFADISAARLFLGYRPEVTLDAGLAELGGWLRSRRADEAQAELEEARP
jgi:dTDP-L-rhamnose 4-epimerase